MFDLTSFLKLLLTQSGVSGYEIPVRQVIEKTWTPLVDEIKVSHVGSLHGLKLGKGNMPHRSILIAAHMDAIGLMVAGVTSQGFLRLSKIGGIDDRILPGQLVTIHGKYEIPGVIVQPADRLLPPALCGNPVGVDYLFVDTGLLEADIRANVCVGDIVSFAQPPIELDSGEIVGHSLDNRASLAALTYCLHELQHIIHTWDVWIVATVQEEINFTGAYTSPYEIHPDIAIAVDVTYAKGPGANGYKTFDLDGGPVFGWGPVINPTLYQVFKSLAEQMDMPYQTELMSKYSATDADAMQIVAEGIPNMVVGIPLRNMHMPVEMVMIKDIARTGRLLAEFITRLEEDFLVKYLQGGY